MSDKHLIGWDFAGVCRQVGERLEAEYEATKHSPAPYERETGPGKCHVLVKHNQQRAQCTAETLEGLPFVGKLKAVGHSEQSALANLRMMYAGELKRHGLMASWDDCRAHAVRVEMVPHYDAPRIMSVVK